MRKFNRNGWLTHQLNTLDLASAQKLKSNIFFSDLSITKLKCLFILLQWPDKKKSIDIYYYHYKNEGLYSRLVSYPSSLTKWHIKWILPSCGIISYYILWNAHKIHLLAGGTRHICQEADIIPNSAKTCKHLLNKMIVTPDMKGGETVHMCKIIHVLI